MSLVQHSAASPEHYSPCDIIEAARLVMGGIDLDPASTESVNAANVKATHFFDKSDDGLTRPWQLLGCKPPRVWLNPPGGIIDRKSAAAVWWGKLVREWLAGRVEQALFLGFSIEILQTSQWEARWAGAFPFCVPRRRIAFLQERDGVFVSGDQPSHANIIVYLPPLGEFKLDVVPHEFRFRDAFSGFGAVKT